MKKLSLSLLSGLALTGAGLSQLQAQVDVSLNNINGSTDTRNAKFTDLNNTPPTIASNMTASGSFTATDFNVSEGFTIKTEGVGDWDYAAATVSGDVNAYVDGLTAELMNGVGGAWGVNGGTDPKLIDDTGEALVLTFQLDNPSDPSLSAAHQSDFQLNQLSLSLGAGAEYNYVVIVGGTVVASAQDQASGTLSLGEFSDIGDDGRVVIGWDTGAFSFGGLQVDVIPEPSAFALIGGCLALTSVMLRRRR